MANAAFGGCCHKFRPIALIYDPCLKKTNLLHHPDSCIYSYLLLGARLVILAYTEVLYYCLTGRPDQTIPCSYLPTSAPCQSCLIQQSVIFLIF